MKENVVDVDLLLYTVGYETRSGYAVQHVRATDHVAMHYDEIDQFSYKTNLRFANERSHTLFDVKLKDEGDICEKIDHKLAMLAKSKSDPLVIGLDVSSMQKELISSILSGLFHLSDTYDMSLKVIYSSGEYKPPPKQSGVYTDFHPISGLEGWTIYPENPLTVVLGLGYEQDQAAGVLEYFDPSGAWAFVPMGDDVRFLESVKESNESLWSFDLLKDHCFLNYKVDQPGLLFSEVRGLVDALRRKSRVAIVPAGPKIYSAITILVALELGSEVSLWRASSHDHVEISDTIPSGKTIQFDYKFKRHIEEL
jgi:hypothetical protein